MPTARQEPHEPVGRPPRARPEDRYRRVSHWLDDCGELTPRPPLDGSADVDVAVLGAGYTGLWTAYYLLERRPGLRVALAEAEIAGFGASGRNGAWVAASTPVSVGELARRFGPAAARATVLALRDTVNEVGQACAEAGIDAGFHRSGVLRVARGRHELPAVHAAYDERAAVGVADGIEVLDRRALRDRVLVSRAEGALFDPHGATVHPGRLVRGLARAVENRGATIYEQTRVTAVEPDGPARGRPRLRTARGDLRADTVVLAGEAYLTRLPALRRRLLPVYSLIVLTEPVPDDRWDEIGWAARECLASHRLTVDYLSRTADGRILFGGRGAPYHFGSRIADAFDHHGPTHRMLRASLVDWFPVLAGVGFSHAWGGPLGLTRDWLPVVAHNPATGVAAGFGYGGQGLAVTNLAGRILADLITGSDPAAYELPFVGHRPRRWEPEPLRWLGARYVQIGLGRLDARAARCGEPPTGRSLPERLARH